MWWKSRKSQALCVDRQEFDKSEINALISVSKSPLFKKMRKELHCEIVSRMLIGKADNSYREGWLDCVGAIDGMIDLMELQNKTMAQKSLNENGETSSMQIELE